MTYLQVVKTIEALLLTMPTIATVKNWSPKEWLNYDGVPVVPVALYTIDKGQLNIGREQQYQISFWFLDKSGAEGEFETQVISDQHQIANDVVSKLRVGSNPYTIDEQINWEALSDKHEDYYAGVTLTINFNIVSNFGACDVPTI